VRLFSGWIEDFLIRPYSVLRPPLHIVNGREPSHSPPSPRSSPSKSTGFFFPQDKCRPAWRSPFWTLPLAPGRPSYWCIVTDTPAGTKPERLAECRDSNPLQHWEAFRLVTKSELEKLGEKTRSFLFPSRSYFTPIVSNSPHTRSLKANR